MRKGKYIRFFAFLRVLCGKNDFLRYLQVRETTVIWSQIPLRAIISYYSRG